MASRVECVNLQQGRKEMVSQTQQAEVDVNEALKPFSASSASVCAQMCLVVQGKL